MERKQRGGAYRPRGLVNRGSGRIDRSTGNLRLPVDDVLAVLGRNEYVVNAGAVRKVGTKFLDKLNNTGLGKSTLPRGTGMYGNYQRGGRVRKQSGGGACPQGQHMMPNGQCMNDSDMPTGGGYRNGGRTKPVRQRRPRIQGKQYSGAMGISENTTRRKRIHKRRRKHRPHRYHQLGGTAGYYDPYSEQRGGISSIKAIIGRGGMGPSGDQTMEHDVTDCIKSNLQGRLGQICQNYILIQ